MMAVGVIGDCEGCIGHRVTPNNAGAPEHAWKSAREPSASRFLMDGARAPVTVVARTMPTPDLAAL